VTGRLHPDDIDGIIEGTAQRVVELLEQRPEAPARMVDANTLAEMLGTSAEFVRDHKRELGYVPVGSGPRPRLRFDAAKARAAYEQNIARPPTPRRATLRRRRRRGLPGR
jgi:hypothetical protein